MRRAWAILAVVLTLGMLDLNQSTFAQKDRPDLVDPGYRGTFIRSGAGFACRTDPGEKLSPDQIKALSEHACLRIGPFVVGSKAAVLKSSLGEPNRTQRGAKDTTVWVYFFGKTNDAPYLVASIWHDRLVAIQITGRMPADDYGFNGIALGAATATVLKFLGKPMDVKPSSEPNTDVWSYQPWPFSLEVTNGQVNSIRVADPQFN
jgi:hypothetical protein